MPAPSLQPIQFRDFSPGIRQNPGAQYPTGTAASASRCISLPGGGLTGLPRRSTIYAGNDFLGANPASGYYLVTGLFVVSPILTNGAPNPYSGNPTQLFLGVEWQDGTNHQFRLERLRIDENPMTRQTIETTSFADTTVVPAGWGLSWGLSRANRGATTSPGIPVLYYAWAPTDPTKNTWFLAQYPNDSTPTSDTPYHIGNPTITAEPIIAVHQGRVIISEVSSYGFGSVSSFGTSENIRFTDVYNPTVISAIENFVPENPTGYSAIFSMSANELFLLKQQGGVVVTGDVADPLVTNLPMVVGAEDIQRPTPSVMGLIYGSRWSGLWAWNHGDGSTHLSPYMNQDFWTITASEVLLGQRYQFATVDNWVMIPNNYLFDCDSQSFWQLDDTSYAQVRFWGRSQRFIYGAISSYTHGSLNTIFMWDLALKSSSYTWTSQPVWAALDAVLETREVVVEAQGQGTVQISARDKAGTLVGPVTLTLANTGYPERLRQNFTGKLAGLALTITADSGNTGINAPDVFGVDVLVRSQEHLKLG